MTHELYELKKIRSLLRWVLIILVLQNLAHSCSLQRIEDKLGTRIPLPLPWSTPK